MRKRISTFFLSLFLVFFVLTGYQPALAAAPTDEILNFDIYAMVNDDASVTMFYHIDWKVLDSDKLGPLEWVEIGLPNNHFSDVIEMTDNIKEIKTNRSSVSIYFDQKYYKDDIASFDFAFQQNNLYQIDKYTEGETVYAFTPAWFDDIAVDHLRIYWSIQNTTAWQPDCTLSDEWLCFEGSLKPGDKYNINVTYPNDAYPFAAAKSNTKSSSDSSSITFDDDPVIDAIATVIAVVLLLGSLASPFVGIYMVIRFISNLGRGFGSGSHRNKVKKKVITRTIIEY